MKEQQIELLRELENVGALSDIAGRLKAKIWRGLLGFAWREPYFLGFPQRLFKPQGLIIFDAPPGSTVAACIVGVDQQVLVSCDPVPAQLFAVGQSFEKMRARLAEGFEPAVWPDFDVVNLGCFVRIMVRDRQGQVLGSDSGIQLAMWGVTIH